MKLNGSEGPEPLTSTTPIDLTASSDLDIRQMRATYYGLVNEVDYQLGRIIDLSQGHRAI